MTPVALRPAIPADSEFCYQLHKAAMSDYITAIWGWDEQRQRAHHTRSFNPGRWQIITVGRTDIGMLDVEYRPGEIYISRIEIHPDYQGRGIGTFLIGGLADEARRNGQDLVLDVLTVNHRAQALYQRLGMKEVARHGDNNIKITMRLPHSPLVGDDRLSRDPCRLAVMIFGMYSAQRPAFGRSWPHTAAHPTGPQDHEGFTFPRRSQGPICGCREWSGWDRRIMSPASQQPLPYGVTWADATCRDHDCPDLGTYLA